MAVSGIILAGGRSSRMGRDKTLLQIENETLIERTVNKLRQFADEIIIASNDTAKFNLPGTVEVLDTYPGGGPLGGMHAGLMAARHQYSFIVSCDMPFFNIELARLLFTRRLGVDVVVPKIGKHLEPLCAVYSRNCLKPIENCLQANIKQVYQIYAEVRTCQITENELRKIGQLDKMFLNLNTPEDLDYL